MLKSFGFFFFLMVLFSVSRSFAADGLVIHGAEMGIGKFHRYDNKVHPYSADNVWKNYVLPDNFGSKSPVIQDNSDGSVTIFFSSLEEFLSAMVDLSKERQKKIQVININAHGLPGAMWFPATDDDLHSAACADWVRAANGDDKANYDQYYSPVSRAEIISLRVMSYLPIFGAPCTTGVKAWKSAVDRLHEIHDIFETDAQLHLFSCVVGYGRAGDKFVSSLASLLFSGEHSKVEASMNFGLGDWSMPEGMGFWDFHDSDQLRRDNEKYPVDRQDRELMQKGRIRLAEFSKGEWKRGILKNQDFMYGKLDSISLETHQNFMAEAVEENKKSENISRLEMLKNIRFPLRVRIPGTAAYVDVN